MLGRYVLEGQAQIADDSPIELLATGTGKMATGQAWTYVQDQRPLGRRGAADSHEVSPEPKSARSSNMVDLTVS